MGTTANRIYIAIDLKSFYASVECVNRNIDPLTANLVVADKSRTEKTICLAVSPALKAYGIPGRARLFEVIQKVNEINRRRLMFAPNHKFIGSSIDSNELKSNPSLSLDYIVAPPRMSLYVDVSTKVYEIYLKYIAPEDIHVYSIDEVFIDTTHYLKTYNTTPRGLAMTLIRDVLKNTGITATAGIGTNMYLCKIAMDIMAKKIPADKDGVRIAELDEMSYRRQLWNHRPLTDFWRIGKGYAQRLESKYLYTMGDIARCSVQNEDLLYKMFGVNAELLIDHAWGWEPCTIKDVKAYKPQSSSISSGQVLTKPYNFENGRLIVREMTDQLVLELVKKGLVTDQMVLTVGYDIENLSNPELIKYCKDFVTTDSYGRRVPKNAHGSVNLGEYTSSTKIITEAVCGLYNKIVDSHLLVRRIYVVANHTVFEESINNNEQFEQLDLFTDYTELESKKAVLEKERRLQNTLLRIKGMYGKNAILKGMNFEEEATTRERNNQIGGHRA